MSYVYRAFDADGAALYVGCTENLAVRLKQHAINSPWWVHLARFVIDRCDSVEAGYQFEAEEIQRLRPAYNKEHFGRSARSGWPGKRPAVEAALAGVGGFTAFVTARRAAGDSWETIARRICQRGTTVTSVSVQKWAVADGLPASLRKSA